MNGDKGVLPVDGDCHECEHAGGHGGVGDKVVHRAVDGAKGPVSGKIIKNLVE